MKKIALLAALCQSALVLADDRQPWRGSDDGLSWREACGDESLFVVPATPRDDAERMCANYGGTLAQLNNGNFLAATGVVFNCIGPMHEAWIKSYDSDSHQGTCLVLTSGNAAPGGAVNAPSNCYSARMALCMKRVCDGKHCKEPCNCPICPTCPKPPKPPKPSKCCGCNCECREALFEYAGDKLPDIGFNKTWNYFIAPALNFTSDDGELSVRNGKLHVDSNPFTQSSNSALDHVKYLLITTETYDVPSDREISFEATIASECHNVTEQPFGGQVLDPESDLRLAAAALNVLDLDHGLVFDFLITNKQVYALYERLDSSRMFYGNYASFTQPVPVMNVAAGEEHCYMIVVDGRQKTIRWLIDGEEVYRVQTVAQLISREFMLVDRGGNITEFVFPEKLQLGFGTFDILDGYSPCNVLVPTTGGQRCAFPANEKALVKLQEGELNARTGMTPAQFVVNGTDPAYRLWGQGVTMDISKISIGICKCDEEGDHDDDGKDHVEGERGGRHGGKDRNDQLGGGDDNDPSGGGDNDQLGGGDDNDPSGGGDDDQSGGGDNDQSGGGDDDQSGGGDDDQSKGSDNNDQPGGGDNANDPAGNA